MPVTGNGEGAGGGWRGLQRPSDRVGGWILREGRKGRRWDGSI